MSISESINVRHNQKLVWEKEFEKNYKKAADHIAQRFAADCFAEVVNSVKNPYTNLYSSERKYVASLFFDITFKHDARKLHKYLAETKLAPFNEWVAEFSNGNSGREYDRGYFQKLMQLVGNAAVPALKQTCQHLASTCKIEGNKLNFEATYEPRSISMSILFWFDSDTLPYQSSIIKNEEKK